MLILRDLNSKQNAQEDTKAENEWEYGLRFKAYQQRVEDLARNQQNDLEGLCGRGNMTTGSSQTISLPEVGDIETVKDKLKDIEDYKIRFTDKLDTIVNLVEEL